MSKTITKQQLKQIINEVLNEIQADEAFNWKMFSTTSNPKIKNLLTRWSITADAAADSDIAAAAELEKQRAEREKLAAMVGGQSFKPSKLPSAKSIEKDRKKQINNLSKQQDELMIKIKQIEDELLEIAYGDSAQQISSAQRTRFFNKHKYNSQSQKDFIESFPESEKMWNDLNLFKKQIQNLAQELRPLLGLPSN